MRYRWDCDAQIHSDKRKRATQKFIHALEHFISGEEHFFIDLIYKVSESSSRKFDCCWNKIQQNPSFSERRKETAKLLSDIHLASPWRKKIQNFRDHKMTFEEAISHWDVRTVLTDIPHIPSKFVEIAPLSHRQGNCIPYAAIRWHDFGNRPALGRPLGHFSRHPDTPLLSLSPRRRFPRPTPERVFVADHQSSSGFSGTGPSAPPPQPIGT